MAPKDFLKLVWPNEGYYAIAVPYTVAATGKRSYRHHVFDSVAQAAHFAEINANSSDVFFCVAALRERKVFNPLKNNARTGEKGVWERRTKTNMLSLKAFFLDLDVGKGTPQMPKYATQQGAFAALTEFVLAAGLPQPMVVSSGGGLHVYWPLTTSIASEDWVEHAHKLHAIVRHFDLLADPTRVHDQTSVLRVVGTFNRKREEPRPVEVLVPAKVVVTPEDFIAKLDELMIQNQLTARKPVRYTPVNAGAGDGWDSNLESTYEGPPVSILAVFRACKLMRHINDMRGNMPEPVWYHALNVVRFTKSGRAAGHKLSKDGDNYSPEDTDAKLDQLEAARGEDTRKIGPTSCRKLADVAGDEHCVGCKFLGRVKGPISAALLTDPAAPPVVATPPGLTVAPVTLPDPPEPFLRTKDGKIAYTSKNKDGDEITSIIYDHDLYPIRRMTNPSTETEQQLWRVVLPHGVTQDFVIDADALYDRRKFVTTVTNHGIYPSTPNVPYVQDYMVAYIQQLQKAAVADLQHTHLGWTDETRTKYVMPDKTISADGTVHPTVLSVGATRASNGLHKKGTLEKQVQLLQFYLNRAYIKQQIFILGGLASPFFHATGHHGVIVNASGEAGASKSTSLYTAASLWGHPKLSTLNGTNDGATTRARNERVTVLANYPVCVDEVTKMPIKEVQDLSMNISQPAARLRLQNDGVERLTPQGYKSSIMLSTANSSLHGMLSTDNNAGTAGSMRVVELIFTPSMVHKKFEADDYLRELLENYGHIGEAFMAAVIRRGPEIEAAIRAEMKSLEIEANMTQAERFWSAYFAAILVCGREAYKLGLIGFDMAYMREFILHSAIPQMRGVVRDEYSTPTMVLTDFLEQISHNTLITGNLNEHQHDMVEPRGPLLAHYDRELGTLHVLRKAFKDYCTKIGANSLNIIEYLSNTRLDADGRARRIITNPLVKKTLGARTRFGKTQSWCFLIDMTHPELTDLSDIVQGDRPPLGARPPLKAVS